MQINYNIVWIDDEIDKLEAAGDISKINDFIISLGFSPTILQLKDGKNIADVFEKKTYDLIISDYNIEEGHHGDTIIKEIRDRKIFNEVLFYSSQADLNAIAMKLLGYDRISFHYGRRGLTEKIETLIKLAISKLLELNATRGLVTAETSELDVMIEDVVMNIVYSKLQIKQDEIDQIINSYVEEFLKKSPETFLKKYEELGFEKRFYSIEAMRKWGIFRDLLKKINSEEIKTFLSANKTYSEDVIIIRNKFAHAKAIIKEKKLYLAGFGPDGAAFEFNEEQCIEIRKKLIGHRTNFNELMNYLGIDHNITNN